MFPLAALLLASTLHAGPEIPVTPSVPNAQPYLQRLEDAAGNDEQALVVWREDTLVRGVRVDRDGTTLDAVPLVIAYAPWEGTRVARGATNWLVVYGGPSFLEARIISDTGAVGPVIPIADTSGTPDIAFDGNQYLVAWWDGSTSRIRATRISANGDVLESAIPLGELTILDAVFAAPGGGFIAVVQKENVQAVRLDAQAREVSRTTLMPTIQWFDPVFGLDASGHVVLGWTAVGNVAYVKREGREPVALDATRVEDFVTIGATTYAIAWRDEDLVLARLDGTIVRELEGPVEEARAVSFGNRVLLAHSYTDVFRTMLDASLETLAPAAFVYAEPQLQLGPAIARAGSNTLVAWIEGEALAQVRVRIDDGAPIDVGQGYSLQVATDGRDFLVTWTDVYQQHYRVVSRDGTLGSTGTIPGPWIIGGGCATWNGDEYLIGYVIVSGYPRLPQRTALAQRVTRDGTADGDPIVLRTTDRLASVACASTDATSLFVTSADNHVSGATLTRGGTISLFDIGTGSAPSVAAHADSFVAAWSGPYPATHVSWAAISEGGTVGLEHTLDANTIRVASRPGGYLLMYGTEPLRVRPIDRNGDVAGPELAIASNAALPAFAGGTLAYMRNTDILPQPRWRVFLRDLDFGSRRRVTRH